MIDTSKFVNHFTIDPSQEAKITAPWEGEVKEKHLHGHTNAFVVENLVPRDICALLRNELAKNSWLAVGTDGRANKPYDVIGNYRLSNYNPALAEALWKRLRTLLRFNCTWACSAVSPTDHGIVSDDPLYSESWRPVGVSPLFRYIRYTEGGQLVAHYDETFIESDTRRTLQSLVIYLTTNERGATRFIRDPQQNFETETFTPMHRMDFRDWDRPANEEEVLARSLPIEGSGLIFPHRELHDSEPLREGDPEKIIIRTDIIYERI